MEDDRERKRYHGKMRSEVIIPDVVQERAELTFEKSEQKRERGSLKCVPGKKMENNVDSGCSGGIRTRYDDGMCGVSGLEQRD